MLADPGRQLDDGRMQLRLELTRQPALLRTRDELLYRRRKLERRRIEDPELLLDAHGQGAPEVLFDQLALTPWTGPPAASHA